MFTKLYPRVKIYGDLVHAESCWITDKKIISNSNSNRELPHGFDTIQLHTSIRLELYYLNKHKWWK